MSRIHYENCPACAGTSIAKVLVAKDYTVSHEKFEIWQCATCLLRFTQDVPSQDEIGRYYQSSNYVSHTDTREGLINSIYHRVRNITLAQKEKLISATLGSYSGNLLDIGAGTGAFASFMRSKGWKVTALEPDEATRNRAYELHKLSILPAGEIYNLPAESFDAITMWHVLEHVHDLHGYLDKIRSMLKPKGVAFIAVPNFTSKDARSYGEFWAAYDVPRHLYHFSPTAMKMLMQQHGLRVSKMSPMWFDSFYVSMLSEKYKTGSSGNLKAFITGIRSNLKAMSDVQRCSSLIYLVSH